jgi:hypothetical protein
MREPEYVIDWSKVQTLDDMKLVMQLFDFAFRFPRGAQDKLERCRHLLIVKSVRKTRWL